MPERKKYLTSVFENSLLPGPFSPLCVEFWTAISSHFHNVLFTCIFSLCCLGCFLKSFSLCGFFCLFGVFLSLQQWLQVATSSLSQLEGVSLNVFILPVLSLILVHFFCLVLYVMTATKVPGGAFPEKPEIVCFTCWTNQANYAYPGLSHEINNP